MLDSEILSLSLPLYLTAGGLGLLILPWLVRLPRLAIATLLFSLVLGQTVRLTLPGQGGGILLSDIAVVITLTAAVINMLLRKKREASTQGVPAQSKLPAASCQLLSIIFPFILWSLYTLAINAPQLGLAGATISFSYWLRLTAQLLLLPALLFLLRDRQTKKTAYYGLLVSLIALLVLGLAQLLFLPSLAKLVPFGWDPHQHRLVSTWLDPNFFGAFLAATFPFILLIAAKLYLARKRRTRNIIFKTLIIFIPLLSLTALFFTQSRSSLLALTAVGLIASPFIIMSLLRKKASIQLVIIAVSLIAITLLLAAVGAFFLKSRLYGLLTIDATAQLRLDSIKLAWTLAKQNAWLGVGYNAYQFAALDAGIISNFNIHSRAGTDNSLLALWITVGLPGLILFFTPFAFIAHVLFRRWLLFNSRLALAALISAATLLVHAQFVNSLLYSHLLITIIIILALALSSPSTQNVVFASNPPSLRLPRACRPKPWRRLAARRAKWGAKRSSL